MSQIFFCQMTQNRLVETATCLNKYLPYVDGAKIVDGGSVDDSIFYLRNWAEKDPRIQFQLVPWSDNFSKQRNEYLKLVPDNAWCLVSDPDEVFEDTTLQNLRGLVDMAEHTGKNMIGFQCRSVSLKGPHRVWESLDNYWKRLLFKKFPNTHYVGNPHEHLANHPMQIMDTKFIYEHIKQENMIWHRGFRNFVVGGGGPNLGNRNQYWVNFRNLMNELGLQNWHQLDQYLIKGNIDQRMKNMFYTFKDLKGFDGASEHREGYKTYFRIYHTEEEPNEFKGTHVE